MDLVQGPVGEVTQGANPGWLKVYVGAPPVQYEKKGFPDVKVVEGGRLTIDGQRTAPIVMTSSLQTPDRYQDYLKGGVRIFRIVPQNAGQMITAPGGEEACFSRLIEGIRLQVETIHAMDKDAKFILMLALDMSNDWVVENPEEAIVLPDGQRIHASGPNNGLGFQHETPNGAYFLRRVGACVAEFVKRLETQPYAHIIIGVNFSHGRAGDDYWGLDTQIFKDEDGKWIIPDRYHYVFGDVGLAARRNFRDWLKAKYQTNENLSKSWNVGSI